MRYAVGRRTLEPPDAPWKRTQMLGLRTVARVLMRALADIGKVIRELGSHEAYLTDLYHRGDSSMRGGDPKPEARRRDFTE